MTKEQKNLGVELVKEVTAQDYKSKLPSKVVILCELLIFAISIAKIFTSDQIDTKLTTLQEAINVFLLETK